MRPIGLAVSAAAATVVLLTVSTVSPPVKLSADTTALIVCGTTCPTPDETYIDIVKNQYIAPTHPGDIDYVPVTTTQEMWPFTGLMRLLGMALGDKRIFAPGGPAWPDVPWWKLSGFFDATANQSLHKGAAALEAAIAANGNEHLVIYGLSQGAGVANVVKRSLAEQYPTGTDGDIPDGDIPDIDFVLSGDPNLPNGGLMSRFPGLYIPIIDMPFNGPAVTDTPFETVEINRQYDGFTDFPLYPLNLLADLNAIFGLVYVHMYSFDVSLPAQDPTQSPAYRGVHGDTSYYFFENPDLPLFGPLRTLGVPEPLIDVVEPLFRVFVELGYDRSIPMWEPTPARLIPRFDPEKLIVDLVNAVGEAVDNALALVGLPPLRGISAPVSDAAPPAETVQAEEARPDALRQETSVIPSHIEPAGSPKPLAGNGQTATTAVSSTSERTRGAATSDSPSPSSVDPTSEPGESTLNPVTRRLVADDSRSDTQKSRGPATRSNRPATPSSRIADPGSTPAEASSPASSSTAAASSAAGDSTESASAGSDADASD